VTGHGKVILLGEHAVVYGHPALAGAIGLGVTAVASPSTADRIEIPAWDPRAPWMDDAAHPVRRALAAIKEALDVRSPFAVVASATVPPRAGLGSSAALAVAVVRALALAVAARLDDDAVEQAAMAAERVFHGTPSGIDVALATRGGLGLFRRGEGLSRIEAPPLRLALALAPEPRDTAASVARVAARLAADPAGTNSRLARLGELALAARPLVERADRDGLVPLFAEAQSHLGALGVSSPGIDRLCALARSAGSPGVKLTGAGGGGAVIAVAPSEPDEQALLRAWRKAGFVARAIEVGVA
jgi:mevalonate kinase